MLNRKRSGLKAVSLITICAVLAACSKQAIGPADDPAQPTVVELTSPMGDVIDAEINIEGNLASITIGGNSLEIPLDDMGEVTAIDADTYEYGLGDRTLLVERVDYEGGYVVRASDSGEAVSVRLPEEASYMAGSYSESGEIGASQQALWWTIPALVVFVVGYFVWRFWETCQAISTQSCAERGAVVARRSNSLFGQDRPGAWKLCYTECEYQQVR